MAGLYIDTVKIISSLLDLPTILGIKSGSDE
jgi:hypothetical protein